MGHRQAFAWIDDWFGMTIDDVREYEKKMQEETNEKVKEGVEEEAPRSGGATPKSGGVTPTTPTAKKGWFQWS